MKDTPPPEPWFHLQGQDGSDRNQSQGNLTHEVANVSTPDTGPEPFESSIDNDGDKEDAGEEKKLEIEDISEMEELLRQNSEISSSSDEDDPDDPTRIPKRIHMDERGWTKTSVGPASTLAVITVALWQLRIPVLYKDLARFVPYQQIAMICLSGCRIIESYELPYLDPVRLLPSNMVIHLTKHNIRALSPHVSPLSLLSPVLRINICQTVRSCYIVSPQIGGPTS